MDTRLSHSRPCLELGRGIVAERGVPAQPIIEHLDILKDVLFRVVPSCVVPMGHEFALERPEKAFDTGIVPAVAWATPAGGDAVLAEQPLVARGGILAASIHVMQERGRWCAMLQGHRERLRRAFHREPGTHRPANHGA